MSRSEIVVPIAEMGALEQVFRERAQLVDRHVGYCCLGLQPTPRELPIGIEVVHDTLPRVAPMHGD